MTKKEKTLKKVINLGDFKFALSVTKPSNLPPCHENYQGGEYSVTVSKKKFKDVYYLDCTLAGQ